MLLATVWVARAFSFSLVTEEGQRLYYTITSDNTVKVVAPGENNDWIGYTSPSGRLNIPAEVVYEGTTYAVTAIDRKAFQDCLNITSVHIPSSVQVIGMRAFVNDSAIVSLTIDEGLQNIELMAFQMCTRLDSIQLPSTLTRIAAQAFYGTGYYLNTNNWTADLTLAIGQWLITTANTVAGEVMVNENIVGIANNAFYACRYMTGVTLPSTLRYIGDAAFQMCQTLDTVRLEGTEPPALIDDSFFGIAPTVVIPCSTMAVYHAAPYWGDMHLIERTCDPGDDTSFHPHLPYPVTLSINDVEATPLTVTVSGDGVTVYNAVGERLSIFDLMGRCIASVPAAKHEQHIALPACGLYVLRRQNGECHKISYSNR